LCFIFFFFFCFFNFFFFFLLGGGGGCLKFSLLSLFCLCHDTALPVYHWFNQYFAEFKICAPVES